MSVCPFLKSQQLEFVDNVWINGLVPSLSSRLNSLRVAKYFGRPAQTGEAYSSIGLKAALLIRNVYSWSSCWLILHGETRLRVSINIFVCKYSRFTEWALFALVYYFTNMHFFFYIFKIVQTFSFANNDTHAPKLWAPKKGLKWTTKIPASGVPASWQAWSIFQLRCLM